MLSLPLNVFCGRQLTSILTVWDFFDSLAYLAHQGLHKKKE